MLGVVGDAGRALRRWQMWKVKEAWGSTETPLIQKVTTDTEDKKKGAIVLVSRRRSNDYPELEKVLECYIKLS